MPKKLEQVLDELREWHRDGDAEAGIVLLRSALCHRSNHAVGKAAQLAGEAELRELEGDLLTAYERFSDDPTRIDPGCIARIGIGEALDRFHYADADFYRAMLRTRQPEGIFPQVDAATPLRAFAVYGLARSHQPGVLDDLAEALVEKEGAVRAAAAGAIAASSSLDASALLRMKLRVGDSEPEVIQSCLLGLLQFDVDRGLPLLEEFLMHGPDPRREAAAYALGESRHEAAAELLIRAAGGTAPYPVLAAICHGLAMSRRPESIECLLRRVESQERNAVRTAADALLLFRHDPNIADRVRAALTDREDERWASAWR